MTKIYLAAALAISAAAGSASAEGLFAFDAADGGGHVAGFAGAATPGDAELASNGANLDAGFEAASTYGVTAGYRLPFKYWTYFQPRLELEISATGSDLSDARFNGAPRAVTGEQSTTLFLFNNYNDITWRENQTLVPFLGGGIGVANVDLSLQEGGIPAARIEDDTTALATTFAGGVTWHTSDRIELYGEARYVTIYGAEFDRIEAGNPLARTLEDDLTTATFTLGVRLNF